MDAMRTEPTSSETVAEVMRRWPRATAVFLAHGMACAGCAMSPFDTVADAALSYGLEPAELVAELVSASSGSKGGKP
ncbi:MAG: DUF1858 domain-containing protein [Acidobacteriia bacterium]|nr:DUF1858 domain-containing protein [Terriglobia bacterium]